MIPMLCIIAFIVGIVVTLFVNGVFSLKESLDDLWRSKILVATVIIGVVGITGVFQHWTLATAVCFLILCGLAVYSNAFSQYKFEKQLTETKFWIEVKLEELKKLIGEEFEEVPNKDVISELLKKQSK